MSCLYILDVNPWLVTLFANIFFHSVLSFILLIILLINQISLIMPHLFIFAYHFALGNWT